MKFDESFIFKLKSLSNISTVFSAYVELKNVGSNKRCCCPFHAEKTPSCFIYESTQSFYCFGCGIGGDVITFIEKIENFSYVEAVKFLAEKVGLALPSENINSDYIKKKSLLYKINRSAAIYYYKNLAEKKEASGLGYLNQRGIKKSTVVNFGLGFALNNWTGLLNFLKCEGYSQSDILSSGLVVKTKSGGLVDKFRNRLMFPIVNCGGKVIGFGGRLLHGKGPKYLNSSESVVFKKGLELYGLNLLKNDKKVKCLILCEGYFDVVSLYQFGFKNCVATLGTSLTKNQVLLISRFCSEVVLAYDSDIAGKAASSRALNLLESAGLKVRFLNMKGAKDPDEYLNKYGAARFKNILEQSQDFENLIFKNLRSNFEGASVDEQRNIIHKMCLYIAKINDLVKRDVFVRKLSFELKLSRSVVNNHVNYIIKKNRFLNKRQHFKILNSNKNVNETFDENFNGKKFEKIQEFLLQSVFLKPQKLDDLINEVSEDYFTLNSYRSIFNCFLKLKKEGLAFELANMRIFLNDADFSNFCRIINSGLSNTFDDYSKSFDERTFKFAIEKLKNYNMKNKSVLNNMSLKELELMRLKQAKAKC